MRPSLKTLFISGYTDEAIVRHGVALGSEFLLAKPFTMETLAGKIREILSAV